MTARNGWLLATLLLGLSIPCMAAEFIESFHSDIEVRRNGDLQVTETIRVRAEGKEIRRGIYRDFPTRYHNARGQGMSVGFEVLSISRDGHSEPFHIKKRPNGKRVYIGDSNVFLTPGIYEYRLTYLTTRQLGFFDDFDELYWNVTGTDWAFEIKQASALVTLPDSVTDFRLTGFTGPQGSTRRDLEQRRVGNNQAYFETTAPLGQREGLTIVAGWPRGLVNAPDDAQRRAWFFEDNKATIIILVGAGALLIYYLLLWRWLGKDPHKGVIIPRYEPPDGYSPASMRFVQNMGYDKQCFTAAVINLAVKGATEIDDDEGSFKITKKTPSELTLAAGEDQVLKGLFGDGRGNVSIVQSNHGILSRAIDMHRKSLKRDYARKYFNTNSWLVVPGVIATILLCAAAIPTLPSQEAIVKTVLFGVFLLIVLLLVNAAVRGLMRRGKRGLIQFAANVILLGAGTGMFINHDFPYEEFLEVVPVPLVLGIIAMFAMHAFFYQWLKAPTLAGRRLLDKIEGFQHYLRVAEEDEIALAEAPKFTIGLYERYLPYAIALDLENEWTSKLDHAIKQGLVERHYSHPRWYHAHGHVNSRFSSALSDGLNSAIASSSIAPGSSSGSSGGSSGGGGGGGGGGGW